MEAEWAVDAPPSLNLDQHFIGFYIKQERAGEVEQWGRGCRNLSTW